MATAYTPGDDCTENMESELLGEIDDLSFEDVEIELAENSALLSWDYKKNSSAGARGAALTELKKAYQAKSVTSHPDKGGSTTAFQEVCNAYDWIKRYFKSFHKINQEYQDDQQKRRDAVVASPESTGSESPLSLVPVRAQGDDAGPTVPEGAGMGDGERVVAAEADQQQQQQRQSVESEPASPAGYSLSAPPTPESHQTFSDSLRKKVAASTTIVSAAGDMQEDAASEQPAPDELTGLRGGRRNDSEADEDEDDFHSPKEDNSDDEPLASRKQRLAESSRAGKRPHETVFERIVSRKDQTVQHIADLLELDSNRLLRINMAAFPGLTLTSKLQENTELLTWLEEGSDGGRKLKRRITHVNSHNTGDRPEPTGLEIATVVIPLVPAGIPAADKRGMIPFKTNECVFKKKVGKQHTCMVDALNAAMGGSFALEQGGEQISLTKGDLKEAGKDVHPARQLSAAILRENGVKNMHQSVGVFNDLFSKRGKLFHLTRAGPAGASFRSLLRQPFGVFLARVFLRDGAKQIQHAVVVDCYRRIIYDNVLGASVVAWTDADLVSPASARAVFADRLGMPYPLLVPRGTHLLMVKYSCIAQTKYSA